MAWIVGFRPIRRTESSCSLRLCIDFLVVGLQAKTFQISEGDKSRQLLFSPLYHYFLLESECLGWLFPHLLDALNPAVVSILPWHYWLWCYNQNPQNSDMKFLFRTQHQ